jgi:hypothetical protein
MITTDAGVVIRDHKVLMKAVKDGSLKAVVERE